MKLKFEDCYPVQIAEVECSCAAGTVLCNHSVALLYQTAHYSALNLTAVPPILSCIESEQSWHKPRTMGVKPGHVRDMVFVSARPKQRTVGNGVRSKSFKAVRGDMPDPDVLRVAEVYQNFAADLAPLITTMAISADVPLVHSAFGKVQEGSPITFQHPLPVSRIITRQVEAPPPTSLPLDNYYLEPTSVQFVCTHQQQLELECLATTLEQSQQIEIATWEQSTTAEWHNVRKPQITSSQFQEVCHVKGSSSALCLAQRIKKGIAATAAMKRGLVLEPLAIQQYTRIKNTNYWPCGFIIHPDAPWLGSSPDGVVFDPTVRTTFGLLEIKCPNAKSYVDCKYLRKCNGTMKLLSSHCYYWQVQGRLLITGMEWCDFVVYAEDDIFVQRIYRDLSVCQTIREKVDHFFFYVYFSST
ncbi:uncharacterized protein LOC124867367 [Girardinichthys multiradiatus]|uniref:uncharacterized protein LOC124867367 n=1 Tax=Girardinichthys multiradiatus TaxID=208333 RepID=UPI001FAE2D79|nr:uncharacterized protein LOC124867367 [Girardinichthys multiradiatus]